MADLAGVGWVLRRLVDEFGGLFALWRTERGAILKDNGDYMLADGYADVVKKWGLNRCEPVVHPYLGKS
ncbi:MAG: hypothetical protein AAF499_05375 [Pseudomonadota bacterium]